MVKTLLSLPRAQVRSLIRELRSHKPQYALVAQLCLTLCDPMDCSPSGFSVHGFSRQEYCEAWPKKIPKQTKRIGWSGFEFQSLTRFITFAIPLNLAEPRFPSLFGRDSGIHHMGLL